MTTQELAVKDKSETRGYSMPADLHRRIAAEATRRGWSSSHLLREAVRFWLAIEAGKSRQD